MNILIATQKPFANIATYQMKSMIEEAGFNMTLLENYTDKTELLKAVSRADALVVRSDIVDKEVLEAGAHLKIIVRAGAGYDNIDLSSATERSVCVMNTPGQNANAVAELAFGMLLSAVRGGFKGGSGSEIKGKKLGLLAFGSIGKRMAEIAQGFGMKVFAYDAFCPSSVIEDQGVTAVQSSKDLFSECSIVSLHIPVTDETKASINSDLLGLMPDNGIVINTARREIIDEDDLVQVMNNKKDFVYIADVKPACADKLVTDFPNRCFFTPKKMGAETNEANINAGLAAARQIIGFLKDADITFKVN